MNNKKVPLPKSVTKYFWGDRIRDLNWPQHQDYIIQTILEKGDQKATAWLLNKINRKQLKSKLKQLKLSPKAKNFWSIYLS